MLSFFDRSRGFTWKEFARAALILWPCMYLYGVSFHIFDYLELLIVSIVFGGILFFIVTLFFQKKEIKSWSTKGAESKNISIYSISLRLTLLVLVVVLMNQFVLSDRIVNFNAKIVDKYERRGRSFGGPRWEVTIRGDRYGEKKIGVSSGKWPRLRVGSEVVVAVKKGVFGYHVLVGVELIE